MIYNKDFSRLRLNESLAFLSLSLLYSAFLVNGIINILSIALMSAGLFLILITFVASSNVTPLFFLLFFYAIYRFTYYFLLNTNIPINIDFINAEGRFIVYLVIIVAISVLRPSVRVMRKYVEFTLVAFILWASLIGFGLIVGQSFISSSHHQLGLTALTGLLYGLFLQDTNHFWRVIKWFAIASSLIFLVLSGSRTSVLLGIFILFWVYQNRIKPIFKLSGAGLLTVVLIFSYDQMIDETFSIGSRHYDVASFRSISGGMTYGASNPDEILKASDGRKSGIEAADGNILGRAVIYGKAIYLFLESPLFGVGEGRFDDISFCDSPGSVVCIHNRGESQFDGHTAHNAFLHVLAEEGLVGFFFALAILLKLKNRILERSSLIESEGLNPVVMTAVWWCFILASMFHHTLASPLYAFSFLLPLIALANARPVDNVDPHAV